MSPEPIRPITSDHEHSAAVEQAGLLLEAREGTADFHRADALLTLIDAYERKRWPCDPSLDPVDVLKQAMSDEVGHTRRDLIGLLGSASRVSEILAKKRALTLKMIRAISESWGIPIELLAAPYQLHETAKHRTVA